MAFCIVYTSREESTIRDAAVKLISDGLEKQQSSVLDNLFSSSFPQHMVCLQVKLIIWILLILGSNSVIPITTAGPNEILFTNKNFCRMSIYLLCGRRRH